MLQKSHLLQEPEPCIKERFHSRLWIAKGLHSQPMNTIEGDQVDIQLLLSFLRINRLLGLAQTNQEYIHIYFLKIISCPNTLNGDGSIYLPIYPLNYPSFVGI